MKKASLFEDLKAEAAKITDKREAIKILIEKIESNFNPIGFESEVWLDEKFHQEDHAGFRTQYFIGYIPGGHPGTIVVKSIVRDSINQEIQESKIERLAAIESSLVLGAAAKALLGLLQEVRNRIQQHKDALLTINLEALKELASSDFGTELP